MVNITFNILGDNCVRIFFFSKLVNVVYSVNSNITNHKQYITQEETIIKNKKKPKQLMCQDVVKNL